jgi:GNAT superfamily N-acetyltransferase
MGYEVPRPMTLFDDPAARAAIHRLFDSVWPKLPERLEIARRAGADWHAVSTPFARFEGGEALAHVGVITIPMVHDGTPVKVAGIHAVGCHPGHRGRGHIRALLDEALTSLDVPTAQLTTHSPRVFEGAGFRSVSQTASVVRLPAARMPVRKLSVSDAADVALVHRLCSTRTPLSHRLGVTEPGWLLIIDEVLEQWGFERLHYSAELDALLAFGVSDQAKLELLDVVAAELPPLERILACLPAGHETARVLFALDRFEADAIRTEPAWPDFFVMVRGPYPEGPAVLPVLAHC